MELIGFATILLVLLLTAMWLSSPKEKSLEFQVKKLELKVGDILAIRVAKPLNMKDQNSLISQMEKILPKGANVMVFDGSEIDIEIITTCGAECLEADRPNPPQ